MTGASCTRSYQIVFFIFLNFSNTMRKNLPKTLDQLIFCKYTLVFSTKYLVNVPTFTKYLVNSYHQRGVKHTFLLIDTKWHQFSKLFLTVKANFKWLWDTSATICTTDSMCSCSLNLHAFEIRTRLKWQISHQCARAGDR